ncbi:MAG: type IV pilus twitching motility protein PilT [Candidatus Eisenbacteria bacterium]|nr:type IV pilus twitching motility protein PilT [Candidatus Eisenbacteria bacterium]
MPSIKELLEEMTERNASDLYIGPGVSPVLRIDGELVGMKEEPLTAEAAKSLCYSMLSEDQIAKFENEKELDLSFGMPGLSRFRANVFFQRGVVSSSIRQIPFTIPSPEELGLPRLVANMISKSKGLILVTGPTGCGKSTTLASMVKVINEQRAVHIITIEDPIEYVHGHKKSIVDQREVGSDTKSFAKALKYVLRQDPDVILVGEMRDLETIAAALTIAETGHLVLATLHTNSASESVNRIVDVFPAEQQHQILSQIAFVIEGVITQQLIPRMGRPGRVLAAEILIATPAVRSVIREGKIHQLYSLIQTGQKHGMQTMNHSLCHAVVSRLISQDDAMGHSPDPKELLDLLTRRKEEVSIGA